MDNMEVLFEAVVVVVQQYGPGLEVVVEKTITVVVETVKVLAKL